MASFFSRLLGSRRGPQRSDVATAPQEIERMVGIISCSYHVPFCRVEREKISQAWARRAGKGERAAVYFDEDALTLGLEAVQRCTEEKGKAGIDGLYFASTSAPF